jgi:hypothetical protein
MGLGPKPERMSGLRMAVAVLCALLIVFAGVVQVAHTHPGSAAIHADCSLCVAVHIAIHPAQSVVPPVSTAVVRRVDANPVSSGAGALLAFALFTRPPPALTAAA